jgi:hypothetical protein
MRRLLPAALLLLGLSAGAAAPSEVELYAYCDASPRLDGVRRALSLAVTRRSPAVELVAVALRKPGSRPPLAPLRVEQGGLPDTYRAWYPEALCAGPLSVELTLREVRTGKRRTEVFLVPVQKVD